MKILKNLFRSETKSKSEPSQSTPAELFIKTGIENYSLAEKLLAEQIITEALALTINDLSATIASRDLELHDLQEELERVKASAGYTEGVLSKENARVTRELNSLKEKIRSMLQLQSQIMSDVGRA